MPKLSLSKLFYLFLFGVIMTQIYPFYVIPESTLLTTLTIGKITIALVFLYIALIEKNALKSIERGKKTLLFIICAYLLGQTFSILGAYDVWLFVKIYHNSLLSVAIFILSIIFVKSSKKSQLTSTSFILLTGTLFVISEMVFRMFFESVYPLFSRFAQKEILDAYTFNIARGKYALAQSAEMFLPFFLYKIFYSSKIKYKVFFGWISILLFFLSILSNFRTRVLIYMFGAFSCAIIFIVRKTFKIKLESLKTPAALFLLGATIVTVTFYLAVSFSNHSNSFNVVDRFVLQNKSEASGTVETRLTQYKKSIDLFISSPFIGVGLGNYTYSVNLNRQIPQLIDEGEQAFVISSSTRPHSIFFQLLGETGLLGLIPYLILVLYFILNDIKTLRLKKITIEVAYIVSSWSLFIYSMLNPADTVFIGGWFWFLRGVLEGRRRS